MPCAPCGRRLWHPCTTGSGNPASSVMCSHALPSQLTCQSRRLFHLAQSGPYQLSLAALDLARQASKRLRALAFISASSSLRTSSALGRPAWVATHSWIFSSGKLVASTQPITSMFPAMGSGSPMILQAMATSEPWWESRRARRAAGDRFAAVAAGANGPVGQRSARVPRARRPRQALPGASPPRLPRLLGPGLLDDSGAACIGPAIGRPYEDGAGAGTTLTKSSPDGQSYTPLVTTGGAMLK